MLKNVDGIICPVDAYFSSQLGLIVEREILLWFEN